MAFLTTSQKNEPVCDIYRHIHLGAVWCLLQVKRDPGAVKSKSDCRLNFTPNRIGAILELSFVHSEDKMSLEENFGSK